MRLPIAALLALTLSVSAFSPAQALPFGKKSEESGKKELQLPKRNFLPPVAIINGPRSEADFLEAEAGDLEPVALSAITTPGIKLKPRIESLETSLGVQYSTEQAQTLIGLQQELDKTDLSKLWESTIDRNPVIRFSLEKLALPADQHPQHSSTFLRKGLSTLISGATMFGTMMPGVIPGGGSAYQNMAIMSAGNVAQNLVNGNTGGPTPGALSDTEKIQLAGLIDDLKSQLTDSYQSYKTTLLLLKDAQQVTHKNHGLYTEAQKTKNPLAMAAASRAYYQAMLNETTLRQKAKVYRLQLERLAGVEAVDGLQLALILNPDQLGDQPVEQASRIQETAPNKTQRTLPEASQTALLEPKKSSDRVGPPMPETMKAEIGPNLEEADDLMKEFADPMMPEAPRHADQ